MLLHNPLNRELNRCSKHFLFSAVFLLIAYNQKLIAQNDSIELSILSELEESTFGTEEVLNNNFTLLSDNEAFLSVEDRKKYLYKGYEHSVEMSYEKGISDYAEAIGVLYKYSLNSNEELDTAIYYFEKLLESGRVQESFELQGSAYSSIGYISQQKNEIKKSLDYFHLAIESYKQSANPNDVVYPLGSISYLYDYLGDVSSSIKYTKEALKISQLLDEEDKQYNTIHKCSNLIRLFKESEKYDSSQFYLDYALQDVQIFESEPKTSRNQGALFNFYQAGIDYFLKIKKYEEAEDFYQKVNSNIHIDSGWGRLLKIRYAVDTDNIKSLEKLIQNAPAFLKDPDGPYYHNFIYHQVKYFENTGKYKDAYAVLDKINALENENTLKNSKIYSEYMNSKFALSESKHNVELLNNQSQLKSLQTKIAAIGGLFFVLISIFLYRQKLRISEQNSILHEQSKTIKEQSNKILSQTESKEKLFANISHELRTPLTLISSPVNRLMKKNEQNRELQLISRYSNQLLTLTDQILDVTRNNFEGIKVNMSSFEAKSLLHYIQEEFEPVASKIGVELIFENNLNNDFIAVTDTDKLNTVVKNLISNALKYNNGSGSITTKLDYQNENLLLDFIDTGQGVCKEDITFIFDRFFQSSSNNSSTGGVGLGLAICKEYVEKLGGTISVTSTKMEGSQFSIILPVKTDAESIESVPLFEFPKRLSPQIDLLPVLSKNYLPEEYLLIVEDNLDLCKHLNDILKDDYSLSFAHNGKEALRQIKMQSPKAVVTDWMMPIMDGKKLVHSIKEDDHLSSIPILMLTAKNQPEDRLSILRVGVDDYVTKPFVPDSLKAHINHLVELSENRLTDEENNEYTGFKQSDLLFLQQLENVTIKNLSDFDFKLSTISEELNVSPRQLNRKVKALTGLTPKQYVNEFRFKEAKRMLETREHSTVKAVIYSVGFKAEQNFSRNFKKRFGMYPKEILY